MSQKKVLGICGSLRADSYNLKLLRNFLTLLGDAGMETRLYPPLELPLMNEDLEKKPLHAAILDFRKALEEYPIIVVASPEYNASTPGNLKNAID
jgi:chromate reductase